MVSAMFLAGCRGKVADIVVYGSVHTGEDETAVAEAFAVKDGRYVYVGDRVGVEAFIREDITWIIDHTGKGAVMTGCPEGFANFLIGNAIRCMGGLSINDLEDGTGSFLQKVATAYEQAKSSGKTCIYGFGWNYDIFNVEGMPTREQLDVVCPDIALFVNDSQGQKGLSNTTCLRIAGIMDSTGKVLTDHIEGGEICMDADGKPDGLLLERAASFVCVKGLDFGEVVPDIAGKAVETFVQMLHSKDIFPERGSIKVGKCADFILVDKDLFECSEEEFHSAQALSIFFEGEEVYHKEGYQNLR